ncbi:DUF1722 domain-containing protein [Catenovulum sp. SM1970]|uniref:YbgA family protein n=1 Tax=Marinifaba aquimaris TaxID=2741323 RepID=UPI0015736DCA|nr:DUF523 and DUF1722 domain-containing protein [Marinifaba aquimaris]NTS76474.1 DUF1722 domain-containing protein [Marinifaba aquimaris]
MSQAIKLGISACVKGEKVRFDSGHKRSHFCVEELGKHVEYKTFCPEVAVGLPVPRPTIRQVRYGDVIKVCRPDGSGDVTDPMVEYGRSVASKISDLSGFIFCAKSPSCGMERVKVYHDHGKGSESIGIGVFAEQIMKANPNLPCEENGRLNDAILRENFVMRVFAYKNWQSLVADGLTKHKMIEFHSQYKYLIMAHDYEGYRELGQLLARADIELAEQADRYITRLMQALKNKASRKSHTNTLMHLQGYFKKQLSKEQKAELSEHIKAFRDGVMPLMGPITLLKHYLREHPKEYLAQQVYFEPYPVELKLRYGY